MHIFNLKNHFFSETVKGRLIVEPPLCLGVNPWFPLYFFINQSIFLDPSGAPDGRSVCEDWTGEHCRAGDPSWRSRSAHPLRSQSGPPGTTWCWNWSLDGGKMHRLLDLRGKRMWRQVGDCPGDDTQVARAFEEIGKQTGGKLDILAPTLASDNQSWQGPAKVWQPELVSGHASQEWV